MTVTRSGVICVNGVVCGSTAEIYRNGKQTENGKTTGSVSKSQIETLITQINSADYEEIKTIKFTGTCPTAYDGQSVTYTFYTPHGREDLNSCVYDLNRPISLLTTVRNILYPNRAPR